MQRIEPLQFREANFEQVLESDLFPLPVKLVPSPEATHPGPEAVSVEAALIRASRKKCPKKVSGGCPVS
jgi:hypothetical protein